MPLSTLAPFVGALVGARLFVGALVGAGLFVGAGVTFGFSLGCTVGTGVELSAEASISSCVIVSFFTFSPDHTLVYSPFFKSVSACLSPLTVKVISMLCSGTARSSLALTSARGPGASLS